MENNEIQEFEIQCRGHFPEQIMDLWSFRKYSDFKVGFGKIDFKGTETELNELLNDLSKDHSDFKVIGVINKADTLIEVSNEKTGDITVTDLFDQSREHGTTVEKLLTILTPRDVKRFNEFNPGGFRRFWVNKNKLESIINQ